MRLIASFVLFLTPLLSVFAQAVPESVVLPLATHSVPFASEGNAIELELASSSGDELGGAEVAVVAAPTWLRFNAIAVTADATDDDVRVGRLAFDVLREAPIGESADVTFEVRSGDVVVGTHVVRLEVSPPPLALDLPRPNPARGAVAIPFTVPEASRVRLAAYDVLGREVAVLVDGERPSGAYEGRLDAGALAAGVYVVRLMARGASGPETAIRRLTVVR